MENGQRNYPYMVGWLETHMKSQAKRLERLADICEDGDEPTYRLYIVKAELIRIAAEMSKAPDAAEAAAREYDCNRMETTK